MTSDPRITAIRVSLLIAFIILCCKWAAYRLTMSTAIFSDAAESVIHIAATGIAAFSVWYARQPADQEHQYGHGKIAFFSAGFEGSLLLFTSLAIHFMAVRTLFIGADPQQLHVGVLITALAGAINLFLGLYLVRVGKRENAIALTANGYHVLTDVWTSMGVVVGLFVVWLTDVSWLDPVVAIGVGLQILWSATSLMRRSYHGLMDRADEALTVRIQESLRQSQRAGLITDFHELRSRCVDHQVWVDVHLLLPDEMSVVAAHDRATEVEQRLRAALHDVEVVIISSHIEPDDHTRAHPEGHPEGRKERRKGQRRSPLD